MKVIHKLTWFCVFVFVFYLPLSACGLSNVQGPDYIQNKARPVSGFNRVTFSGSSEMLTTQGDSEGLTCLGDEE